MTLVTFQCRHFLNTEPRLPVFEPIRLFQIVAAVEKRSSRSLMTWESPSTTMKAYKVKQKVAWKKAGLTWLCRFVEKWVFHDKKQTGENRFCQFIFISSAILSSFFHNVNIIFHVACLVLQKKLMTSLYCCLSVIRSWLKCLCSVHQTWCS